MSLENIDLSNHAAPIAIGGIGGSGTRLIAEILIRLGIYMGEDINPARDNLWFTLLFKRVELLDMPDDQFKELITIFRVGMTRSRPLATPEIELLYNIASTNEWLGQRARSLASIQEAPDQPKVWGWKEPNTHIVIRRLLRFMPDIKYIHVMRNGLDMAYSANQQQLKLWGPHFIGPECQSTPYYSLRYWHIINQRILELKHVMGTNCLLFSYDQFCHAPRAELEKLANFLGITLSREQIESFAALVKPPESIGRFKQYGLAAFHPDDIAFVKQLGFDTSLD